MIAMRAFVLAIFVVSGVGCDGEGKSEPDMAVAASCRGSLSGVVTETILACSVTWDEMSGTAQIGNDGDITVSDPSQIITGDTFGFVITVDGDARTGTLSTTNVTAYSGGVQVPNDGGFINYIANYSSTVGAPPNLGVMSANLSAFSVDFVKDTESQWIVHGNVTATFVPIDNLGAPAPTSEGTVQMNLDF